MDDIIKTIILGIAGKKITLALYIFVNEGSRSDEPWLICLILNNIIFYF